MAYGIRRKWYSKWQAGRRGLEVEVLLLLWPPVRHQPRAVGVGPVSSELVMLGMSVPELGSHFSCFPPSGAGSLALRSRGFQAQGLPAIGLLSVPGCRLDAVLYCFVGEAPEINWLFASAGFFLDGLKTLRLCQR